MTLACLEIGGAETHVTELAKELKRRGHDVAVISGGGVYVKEIEACGIRHYTVSVNSKNPVAVHSAIRSMERIIISEKPDIVHAHARIPAFLTGIVHRRLSSRCPFVFVTTVHGAYSTSFPYKLLTDWGQMSLAVSDDLKKYLVDNYGIKPSNISVSINGIDGRKFSPDVDGSKIRTEFSLGENEKIVACVTRLDPRVCSHAYAMMDIMPELDRDIPGIIYMLVGNGEAYDDLSRRADEVNGRLGRRAVILTGGRTDVNEILACAEVCVGVSRAILEPMSMKKKCVVVGEWGYIGIPSEDNLEEARACNFTCRDCAPVDKEVLERDIVKLFRMSPDESERVAEYGKSVVERYYSVGKMADDNEAMYGRALRKFAKDTVILGYYGFGNTGDDALLEAIIKDLRSKNDTMGITVLTNSVQCPSKHYDVSGVDRFKIGDVKRAMRGSKLFILGGGSLIQDVTSTKSLLYYLYCAHCAKKMGLKVMLYANGIGPILRKNNRRLAKKILDSADYITLRDPDSLAMLDELGVRNKKVELTADPAFALPVYDVEIADKILRDNGVERSFACISVRRLCTGKKDRNHKNSEMTSALADFADKLQNVYGLLPVFVAMQYDKDRETTLEVISKMKTKGVFIDSALDAETVLGIIAESDCVIALRLHMLIFGVASGKAVLGIEYDPKVKSLSAMIGNKYSITAEEFSAGKYKSLLEEFMNNKSNPESNAKKELPELLRKARRNAEIAASLLYTKNSD